MSLSEVLIDCILITPHFCWFLLPRILCLVALAVSAPVLLVIAAKELTDLPLLHLLYHLTFQRLVPLVVLRLARGPLRQLPNKASQIR